MNDVVQTLKDLGQFKLTVMAGIAALLVTFFVYISMRVATPMMEPLYSNLPMEDSGVVVQELDKQGIKYELRANGSQILVPSDQVLKLRVDLAQKGMPSNGSIVGYEIFDRSDAIGASNFVMNINNLRALEGELARTISSFSNVDSARVHLVMPKRELFTREKQEPTASVVIKFRGSSELGKGEVEAISHLVATAVPGLKPNKITIIDAKGRMLSRGGDDPNNPEVLASNAEEFRVAYEARMRRTVEELLEQSVGYGKVKAQITANIDFDRVVRNSETYDPEGQVARSIQGSSERENAQETENNQNVSVSNNLPSAKGQQGEGAGSKRNVERTDETTNFEISKTVENHVKETGTVNRLSVAVLVDGIYSPNAEGAPTYQPRSAEELKKLETLVKSAIGFDEKRGDTVEIVNMQFTNEIPTLEEAGPFDWIQNDMKSIVQTLVLGGVAILVILMIIRPLVNRAIESSALAAELADEEKAVLSGISLTNQSPDMAALGFSGEADLEGLDEDDDLVSIDRMRNRGKSSVHRRVADAIERSPEEAMNVLRQWFAPAE